MANVNDKRSRDAAINALRGNLMMRYPDAKVVCLAGERQYADKFALAYELAKRFAGMGKKTLFVECAAMERAASEDWQRAGGPALTDYLAGKADAKAIVRSAGDQLDAIASGAAERLGELIPGERLDALLRELREQYDYIIVDATAMGSEADAALVARCCDGTLLVAEYCETNREAAQWVKNELERDGVKLFGLVMIEPAKRKGNLTELIGRIFKKK